MKFFSAVIIAAFSFILLQLSAVSADNSKLRTSLPIQIKSNTLTADNKGKSAVFTGKVVAKQGDVTIYADKMTINYGSTKADVDKIEAVGAVRIVQKNRVGSSDKAVYENGEGRITLTGNPKVIQGDDTLSAAMITYYIDDERSVATGDGAGRVHVEIKQPLGKK